MKKNWNQILESAQPVVDFLSSDSFFSRPYDGDFDWHYLIGRKLIKTNCLGALDKNLHGADKKLTIEGVVNFLEETMPYYMKILLNCYANNYIPEIWKDILYVFQHNGFPCGWKGDYPEGKMIIFSNE